MRPVIAVSTVMSSSGFLMNDSPSPNFRQSAYAPLAEADQERPEADRPEEVHRLLLKAVEELHRDEIGEHLQHAFESVFRLAALARVVPHDDFRDARAVPAGIDGEKAVHFPVKAARPRRPRAGTPSASIRSRAAGRRSRTR